MKKKKWSDELIELSKQYLIRGSSVKSLNGQFGILDINYKNSIYTIYIRNSRLILIYNSIEEIIETGWIID